MLVAAIVALSEAILYMIWESRLERKGERRTRKLTKKCNWRIDKIDNEPSRVSTAQHDGNIHMNSISSAEIRRRTGAKNNHMD